VDVGECHFHALSAREIDASDACHLLPLPLLMLLIGANDPHHTLAADHLALDANLLDRRTNLHSFLNTLPRVVSYGDNSTITSSPGFNRKSVCVPRCAVTSERFWSL